MKILKSITELIDHYDNYIVDVWGVVHNGRNLFDGVLWALEELKAANKNVIFLSNSPRRSQHVIEDLLGYGLREDLFLGVHTSGEDAFEHFTKDAHPFYESVAQTVCYPLSVAYHQGLLEDCALKTTQKLEEAQFILNTGPDSSFFNSQTLITEFLETALTHQLPMVCVNPDMSVIIGEKMVQCAGALAQTYATMGGKVFYHGKPFPSVYTSVLNKFPTQDKARTIGIGDSIATDIQGAGNFGIDSALVLTGIEGYDNKQEDSDRFKGYPVKPTYLMSQFR